jgi:hypothetical protein
MNRFTVKDWVIFTLDVLKVFTASAILCGIAALGFVVLAIIGGVQ